jgi:DNA repair protein SbcD/Mre11
MAFRFLHLGDVHLGTSFGSRSEENRDELRKSLYDTMDSVVTFAIERKVHAVLIAGDLLDSTRLEFRDELFLKSWTERLARDGIPVFYSPGNHDPLTTEGASGGKLKWPAGFTIFNGEPHTVTVHDGEGNPVGRVCGIGHKNEAVVDNLALLFPINNNDGMPAVALLHALLTSAGDANNSLSFSSYSMY